MDIITELALTSLTLSGIYATMALGLTLVYGVTKILNYAYGSFLALGAFLGWTFYQIFNSYPITFLTIIPLLFAFGYLIEKYLLHHFIGKKSWEYNIMFALLGFALLLDNLLLIIYGPRRKILPWILGDEFSSKIMIFIICVVIMVLLGVFLYKTRLGIAVRAVAQNIDGAKVLGIQVDKIFHYIFALSIVIVGVSGVLIAPRIQIFPHMGWTPFIISFVIVVLGGLGSILGTFVAAFIMGTLEVLIGYYLGPTYSLPIFVTILVILLSFKPRGLFGVE